MSTCADMRGCSSLANELSVLAHTWNKLFMTISIDGQLANAYVYVQPWINKSRLKAGLQTQNQLEHPQ